jgi:hypothetical protein
MFGYANDGERIPFDPDHVRHVLTGCILCRRPIYMVGVFIPPTTEMKIAVVKLRQHAIPHGSTACLSYGLCRRHATNPDLDAIEDRILDAARKVRLQ